MASSNWFTILYGPSGAGKSTVAGKAAPMGLFYSPKGGMSSASSYLGIDLKVVPATGVAEATELIRKNHKKYPAITIDDLSLIIDQELARLRKSYSGWTVFDKLNERVYDLRDAAREASCHILLTMHEQPPREIKKHDSTRYIKGGPLCPGYQLPEKLPAMADFVARIVYDPSALGWPYVFQVGPDAEYVTKDRYSIAPPRFPLNIGELQREAGYEIALPKGMEWMEKGVEALAQKLLPELGKEEPDIKKILVPFASKLGNKISDQRHIRWCLSDALDRAVLRLSREGLVTNFIINLTEKEEDMLNV
tara:strand:- start:6879 stop:7799 length:921 start_codon:yes stop_codon:yes gene_type:complete